MIPLSPMLLLSAANVAANGVAPAPLPGEAPDLAGPSPDLVLAQRLGAWSHFDRRAGKSSWPLPALSSCQALAEWAGARAVLTTHPAAGDLFLEWSLAEQRFTRTGIVLHVDGLTARGGPALFVGCETLEVETTPQGARGVTARSRYLSPASGDRFVRWVELDPRDAEAGTRRGPQPKASQAMEARRRAARRSA